MPLERNERGSQENEEEQSFFVLSPSDLSSEQQQMEEKENHDMTNEEVLSIPNNEKEEQKVTLEEVGTQRDGNFQQVENTVNNFIQWLERTGRSFPEGEIPLLHAIFTKTNMQEHELGDFGLKLLAFKNKLELVNAFEVAQTLVKHREPYKKEWKLFEHLPVNLRAIVRRHYVIDFILDSILSLDFSQPKLQNSWHTIIYNTLNEYLTLTETIRRLGIFYWNKFFKARFIKDVPPLLNYYRDLFKEWLNRILENAQNLKNVDIHTDESLQSQLNLALKYIIEIWSIFDRYNEITQDPLLLPNEWLYETLRDKILPYINLEMFSLKSFEFKRLDRFIEKSLPSLQMKTGKKALLFFSTLSWQRGKEFFNTGFRELRTDQPIRAVINTAWALYYLSQVPVNVKKLTKQDFFDWEDFYSLLKPQPIPVDLLLLHFALAANGFLPPDSEFTPHAKLLIALTLVSLDLENPELKKHKDDLFNLMKLLIAIDSKQTQEELVQFIFKDLFKKLIKNAKELMDSIFRDILASCTNCFSDFKHCKSVITPSKDKKPRFFEKSLAEMGCLADIDVVYMTLQEIMRKLGLADITDSLKLSQAPGFSHQFAFRGSISKFTFDFIFRFKKTENNTIIQWETMFTKLSNPAHAKKITEWLQTLVVLFLVDIQRKFQTKLPKQTCVFCSTEMSNQLRNDLLVISCPKCMKPNIPTDF